MSQRLAFAFVLMTAMAAWQPAALCEDSMEPNGAIQKGMRGVVNTTTGWVEIPKRVRETGEASGYTAGLTWGLLRGLGYGFVRTAAGLYELFTFPFPAPAGYIPVMQPEYVFTSTGQ